MGCGLYDIPHTHAHTRTHMHTHMHTHTYTHTHTYLSWLPSFHSLLLHLISVWSVEGCSWWREGLGRRSWAFSSVILGGGVWGRECVCVRVVHKVIYRHTNNSCHAPIITYTVVLSPICSKCDLFSSCNSAKFCLCCLLALPILLVNAQWLTKIINRKHRMHVSYAR